jgi:hypothetical protein
VTPILELEIGLESALAHGASGIHRREKANLVVGLGRVPLSKTLHMDILRVSTTFAGGNKRIRLCVLFVKTHVANRMIRRYSLNSFRGFFSGILKRVFGVL